MVSPKSVVSRLLHIWEVDPAIAAMTKVIARAECFTTSSRVALVIGQRSSSQNRRIRSLRRRQASSLHLPFVHDRLQKVELLQIRLLFVHFRGLKGLDALSSRHGVLNFLNFSELFLQL